MPDGSTQAVAGLTLRATEFTVGSNGLAAMPASLPPNSAYTYCADFSADEELAAGSSTILFDKLVPVYVDNFLNVPVGTLVPAGEYDRQAGQWVPLTNGIVIKILGQSNGEALVDLHGQGQPEPASVLAANGFTTDELQSLANLYPAGKSIWRTLTPRFCAIDYNFGKGAPSGRKPNTPGAKPKGKPKDKSNQKYGTVNFSQQTFTERIPVPGAPFDLNYNSARSPDYKVNNFLTIPTKWIESPPICPTNGDCALPPHYFDPPADMRLEVDIAGEQSVRTYPITNSFATVSWDGRDAYGRYVGGSYLTHLTVSYEFTNWDYFGVCCGPEDLAQFPSLFGNDGNVTSFQGHIGSTLEIGAQFTQILTIPDERGLGLGGWSPSCLHRLDPVSGALYYGDGHIGQAWPANPQTNFVYQIAAVYRCAAAPDGTIYFYGHDTNASHGYFFFTRSPSGVYRIISPTPEKPAPGMVGPSGTGLSDWSKVDGKSVNVVDFANVTLLCMCVAPDGSLYVMNSYVIAKLTPDGIWHVLNGLQAVIDEMPPDGASAQQTFINPRGFAISMAVGPDSSVYFSGSYGPINGTNYTVIRKIATDGRLYTVFGAGGVADGQTSSKWPDLFGQAAYGAHYYGGYTGAAFASMAVGPDGSIYVAPKLNSGGIFKITPGGIVEPFLNANPIQGDDGKSVTNVVVGVGGLGPNIVRLGPDGTVYVDTPDSYIWQVDHNNVLHHIAGYWGALPAPDSPGDNGDPLDTLLYVITDFALTPDNSLVVDFSNTSQQVPYVIFPPRSLLAGLPPMPVPQYIPSDDGREVYLFDQQGKHMQTLDTLTGAIKWKFGYNTNSQIATITDAVGLTTTIARDGLGNATAIVGPYGQTTALQLDANGFLASVTSPANEITALNNSSGGLLRSITGPRGETFSLNYDTLGRFTGVADPLGGGWAESSADLGLVVPSLDYEFDVFGTNSLHNGLLRYMALQANGDQQIDYFKASPSASPSSLMTQRSILSVNGDETDTYADGTVATVVTAADPCFGSQVRKPSRINLTFTNGVAFNATVQRSAVLPDVSNPESFTQLSNVFTFNGNAFTQVYTVSNRTTTLTSPAGRTITNIRDPLGRASHVEQPGHSAVDFSYDSNGRLRAMTNTSSAGPAITAFSYNNLGQLAVLTDPLGNSLHLTRDADGRVIQAILPDGSLASLTYDSLYDSTSVTPPGRPPHTFQYNSVGLLANYTPPLADANSSINYSYDTERDLTQVTFPDGQIAAMNYGWFGELTGITLGNGPTLSYTYDALNMLSVSNSDGDLLQYGYTGSIVTSVTWSGSITGQLVTQLNSDLLPASKTVDTTTVAYSYNHDSLLTQAGDLSITNDPISGLTTATTIGVVTDQRSSDDRGLLTNYTPTVKGAPIWSISLGLDLVGRITNRTETINNQTQVNAYVYDLSGRLHQVWLNGALSVTYSYDTNGNRLTRNAETGTYDAQDRVLTYAGSTFSWSPNGTLLTRVNGSQTTDYTYDLRGALTAVNISGGQQISYIIDAEGRRIGKRVGGVLQRGWLWDGNALAAEVNADSSLAAMFVYGADSPTPSYMLTPTNSYRLLSDERGSVRLVVDTATGAVAQQLSYDEFGRVTADSNPGFQPFGFAGGLYDPDTGLVRFGARDYSSETGAWTARDPLLFQGRSLNLYQYAFADPVNNADPLGTGPYMINARIPSPQRDEGLDYTEELKEKIKEEGIKISKLKALEHTGTPFGIDFESGVIVAHVVEVTDYLGQIIGEAVNDMTGNGLNQANSASKGVDMRGEGAKRKPFDPLDPSSW